ncbi:MAG: hypothetical protein IKO40_13440 [Kiritimatiellae bacterium]|nr:hypothetical protein [Kiritimatiellia bacterium]
MKKSTIALRAICAAALCVAVAITSGCCKKECKKEARRDYKPLAPQGTLISAVYETKGLADNQMMQAILDFNADCNAKVTAAMREAGKDVPMPDVDFAALKEKELANLRKFDWVAFTMAAPSFKADDIEKDDAPVAFPAAAVVYCAAKPTTMEAIEGEIKANLAEGTANLDEETLTTIREFFAENFDISDDTAAGCAIKKFSIKATEKTEEVVKRVKDFEPCYGLYDGTLFIMASSPKAFADTVALYSGKAAATDNASIKADMAIGAGLPQFRDGIYGVASFLKGFLSDEDFAEACAGEPGKFLQSLRDVKGALAIDGEAMATVFSLSASFDDAQLATEAVTLADSARGMLSMLGGAVTMRAPAATPILKIVNAAATKADGDTFTLSFTTTKDDLAAIDFAAILTQTGAFDDDGDEDLDEDDEAEEEDDDAE